MNVLILGASSPIGHELALCFAEGNSLTISGRNEAHLQALARTCREREVHRVTTIVRDITDGVAALEKDFGGTSFDVVINAVSATSGVRDSDIVPSELQKYAMADLIIPVNFIESLIQRQRSPMKLIFVSSVLAAVMSPNRFFYGALKSLQEMQLRKLTQTYKGVELLVVRVGKVIPNDRPTVLAQKFASAVYQAHRRGSTTLNYGVAGWLYRALFYVHPCVFHTMVRLQRWVRLALRQQA